MTLARFMCCGSRVRRASPVHQPQPEVDPERQETPDEEIMRRDAATTIKLPPVRTSPVRKKKVPAAETPEQRFVRYSAKAIRAKREMEAASGIDPAQTYFASRRRDEVWGGVVPSEYGPAETPSDSPDTLRAALDALHVTKRPRVEQNHRPTPADAAIFVPQSAAATNRCSAPASSA